ncbi:MAG: OmpH family outer membrane protein [Thermodesulfobacteria bacterium]|nr:OmpH family outer membrane protein [Thermodesulfobacteriota bacterium]
MRKFLVLGVLLLVLLVSGAQAGEVKIAVLDLQQVVRKSEAGQAALAKLQQKFETLQKKLKAREDELRKFKEELEKKAPLLSPEARQEKEREYQKMLREYQAEREDAQFEMKQAEQKALQPIMKDLEKVVKDMAKREGYDLILEKRMPGIYWTSPAIDITDHVVELYNQYKKGQAR